MSAEIIQFDKSHVRTRVIEASDRDVTTLEQLRERQEELRRELEAIEDLQGRFPGENVLAPTFFARRGKGYGDFMRGRTLAGVLIRMADSSKLERAFNAIVREAMQRRAKGGPNSRKPWTPTSDGFFQTIARYVAEGEILEPK